MTTGISQNRHIANALGCVLLLLIVVPVCFSLATDISSLPTPRHDDPDGGKASSIYIFGIVMSGLISLGAVISLIRSIAALHRYSS